MSDITDIPILDIELFLIKNNIKKKDPYNDAWKLIQTGATYYPDSVIAWMMAHNLLELKIRVPNYTKSDILSLSDKDLSSLATLLGMKSTNTTAIFNILKYLHKLKLADESLFPPEILIELIGNMNYNSIKKTCNSSKQLQILCKTSDVKNVLISKFMKDSLNTSNFTKEELEFYEKVKPLKRRMSITREGNNEVLNILFNKQIFMIKGGILMSKESNINQICGYIFDDYNSNYRKISHNVNILLTDDGIVKVDNLNLNNITTKTAINKTNLTIPINTIIYNIYVDFISRIDPIYSDYVNMTTYNKETYRWNGFFDQDVRPFNVIQMYNFFYLTDKGEVFMRDNLNFENPNNVDPDYVDEYNPLRVTGQSGGSINRYYKIHGQSGGSIPKIKQITSIGFCLSTTGDVYKINLNDLSFEILKYKNIIQIYENRNKIYYLDDQGNIYIVPISSTQYGTVIETSKNLIEILASGRDIYALDNEMKLYIYGVTGALKQTYDFLDL